uniref:Uncharacterized protein n=1 Tax=Panagrellus redivivus TaxID=6233 RepID=A0A7E4VLZ7_PANRE
MNPTEAPFVSPLVSTATPSVSQASTQSEAASVPPRVH